jgi:hypothetical protein
LDAKKDFSLIHYQLIIVEFGGLVGVLWAKPKTMVGALFEGVVDAMSDDSTPKDLTSRPWHPWFIFPLGKCRTSKIHEYSETSMPLLLSFLPRSNVKQNFLWPLALRVCVE